MKTNLNSFDKMNIHRFTSMLLPHVLRVELYAISNRGRREEQNISLNSACVCVCVAVCCCVVCHCALLCRAACSCCCCWLGDDCVARGKQSNGCGV